MSETQAHIKIVGKDQASGEIRKATASLEDLRKAGDRAGKTIQVPRTGQFYGKQDQLLMESFAKAMKGTGEETKKTITTLSSLEGKSKSLTKELANTALGTAAFARKSADLKGVNDRIKAIKDSMTGVRKESALMQVAQANAWRLGMSAPGGVAMGMAAGIAGGVALGAFAVSAANAADELQGLQNRAQIAYGEDFPKMRDAADELGRSLRRGGSDILGYATTFSTLLKSVGVGKKEVQDMGLNLSRMSVNFGKAFRVGDAESFEVLQQALSGAWKSYQRYSHVIANDVLVAENLHKEGIKDKFDEMSEGQQVLARYMFMLEKNIEIEALATKNTGSLDDATKNMTSSWQDFQEAAGPAAMGILATGANIAAGAFNTLTFAIDGAGKMLGNMRSANPLRGGLAQGTGANTEPFGPEAPSQTLIDLAKQKQAVLDMYKNMPKGLGSGADAAKDLKEMKKAMEELGRTYQQKVIDINRKLNDLKTGHQEKMASLKKDLGGVTKALVELQQEYQRTVQKIQEEQEKLNKNTSLSKADAFVQGDDRVRSLQDQLQRYKDAGNEGFMNDKMISVLQNRTKGNQGRDITAGEVREFGLTSDQESILNLQIQLDKELAAQKKFASDRDALQKQMTERSAYYRSSETERAITDIDKQTKESQDAIDQRRKDESDAYTEAVKEQQNKYKTTQDAMAKEEKSYASARDELLDTKVELQLFGGEYQTVMANINKATDDTLTNLKNKLEDITGAIGNIRAAMEKNADVTGGATFSANSNVPASSAAVPNDPNAKYYQAGPTSSDLGAGVKNDPATLAARAAQDALNQASKASQQAIQDEALARILRRTGGKAYASGGVATEPTVGLFGEAGYPEAFVPMPSGNIPVKIQGKVGGDTNVTISIASVTVREEADIDKIAALLARKIQLRNLAA